MAKEPLTAKKIHLALSRSLWPRILSYAVFSVMVVLALPPERQWLRPLMLIIGFVYPTVFYLLAIRAKDTRRIGLTAYPLDAAIFGLAVIAVHYNLSVLLLTVNFACLTALLMGGFRLFFRTILALAVVLLTGLIFVPFEPLHSVTMNQVVAAFLLATGLLAYIVFQVNETTKVFIGTRNQLQEKSEESRRQAVMMASINEVAQLVNSTLDINRVMSSIMEGLNRVFDFNTMATMFLDAGKQNLRLDAVIGNVPGELAHRLQDLVIPMSEKNSAFTISAAKREPRYIQDVSRDQGVTEGVSKMIYQLVPAKSLLIFPLIIDDEVIGVLAFANTEDHFDLDETDIKDIEQYVTYIVSALRNAHTHEKLQIAQQGADEANRAKSQFLANMSHELRTPMNAVIGYSEMLEEEAEDQGLDDFIPDLQRIRSAGRHLLQLINDVLDLSKIEADKVELYPENIHVLALLEEIAATVKPLVEENKNTLSVVNESSPEVIFADATKLRQVIMNLLSNAAKFTQSGEIKVISKAVNEQGTDWLIIDITDTGIGMTAEQIDRLFQPFSQADASTTREFGGTGLGLVISRRYCEMMGGSLEVESEADRGSRFTVRLPVNAGDTKPATEDNQPVTSPVTAAESTANNGAGMAPTILVIDDDESVRDLMHRLLSRGGYHVVTAADGETGLQLARKLKPSVITLDVIMHYPDGWTVLQQLKSEPALADIPVVMQTVLDEKQKGYTLGAADYLSKPIDRKRLLDVVGRLSTSSKQTVLVVEDDLDTQARMKKWLQADGWTVFTADNGLEGLEQFIEIQPAIMILDLVMPKMDGIELIERMRQDYPDADVRVIVVTAKDLTAEEMSRLNGYVQRIIQKSAGSLDDIIDEIKRHLDN